MHYGPIKTNYWPGTCPVVMSSFNKTHSNHTILVQASCTCVTPIKVCNSLHFWSRSDHAFTKIRAYGIFGCVKCWGLCLPVGPLLCCYVKVWFPPVCVALVCYAVLFRSCLVDVDINLWCLFREQEILYHADDLESFYSSFVALATHYLCVGFGACMYCLVYYTFVIVFYNLHYYTVRGML